MSSHRQLHWWSSLLENTHYLSMSISNILEIRIPLKVLKYNILGYVKIRQDIVCTCIWLCVCAKSLQSCLIICNPLDYTPPGSFVHGILQARTLEWVAISFSNAWKWKEKVKSLSCVQLLATPWTAATKLLHPWDFPGKITGVGCHCLLQMKKAGSSKISKKLLKGGHWNGQKTNAKVFNFINH